MIAIYILQKMTDYYQIHAILYTSSQMQPYMNTSRNLINYSFLGHDSPQGNSYRYSSNMLEGVDIEGSIDTSKQMDYFYYNDSVGEIKKTFVLKFVRIKWRPVNLCHKNETVDAFYLLTSHFDHREQRQAIRDTYMKPKNASTSIRYAFLVGSLNDSNGLGTLSRERKMFGDIILGDFREAYQNLTLKVLMGLHYVSMYCPGARFIVKSDDDVFINIPTMQTIVHEINHTRFIAGICAFSNRVIRKVSHRWFVDPSLYSPSRYPPYCMGSGYVMPMAVVRDVLHVASTVPVVPIEDAFVGICINKLNVSVKVVNFGKQFVREFKKTVPWSLRLICALMNNGAPVCVHGITPIAMKKLHACLDETMNDRVIYLNR